MKANLKRIIAILLVVISIVVLNASWISLIGPQKDQMGELIQGAFSTVDWLNGLSNKPISSKSQEQIRVTLESFNDGALSPHEEYHALKSIKDFKAIGYSMEDLIVLFGSESEKAQAKETVKKMNTYIGLFEFLYVSLIVFAVLSIIAAIVLNGGIVQIVYSILYLVIAAINLVINGAINNDMQAEFETRFTGWLLLGLLLVVLVDLLCLKSAAVITLFKDGHFDFKINTDSFKNVKGSFAKVASVAQNVAQNVGQSASNVAKGNGYAIKQREVTWVCTACGAENEDKNKFCGQCGSKRPEIPHEAQIIISNLELERDNLKQQLDISEKKKEELEKKLEETENTVLILNQNITELRAQNEHVELNAKNDELKIQNEKIEKEKAKLTAENQTLEAESQKLTAENKKLTTEIQKLTTEIQKLTAESQKLAEDKSNLDSKLENCQKKISDLEAAKERKSEEVPMKYCRYCGVKIPKASRVCPECGKEL